MRNVLWGGVLNLGRGAGRASENTIFFREREESPTPLKGVWGKNDETGRPLAEEAGERRGEKYLAV